MSLVTFIIPVRHQQNARDWAALKANLAETIASIANQTHPDWRAVIVANEGADLPPLPQRFSAQRVTFPPNDLHDFGSADQEQVYDAFRADKGRRVLAGMLAARDSDYFMIVDDDDLVSARIVEHVAAHRGENGWTIDRGYIWDSGGRLLFGHDRFRHLCGTCLIIRADLYGLPAQLEDASAEWIKTTLGSHMRIADLLAGQGTPLRPLPFPGAVYRVAHGGSHSGAPSLVRKYFLNRYVLSRPLRLLGNLRSLRLVGARAARVLRGRSRNVARSARRMSPTIRQYKVTVSVTPGSVQRRFAAQLGIDCEAFEFRTRTVAPGEPIHVVTVGRMIERKGHRYVIEAVSTLRTRRRDLDVRLDVVGSGPLFAEIRTLVANLRLGPAVRLHGGLANGEIRELLERSHIFALHCVTGRGGDVEELPVSMMEAMAMGLPVVSTRHGGIPGLVADGASGFLVAERDVEGTAAAIGRLADDPELMQQMGRESRAIVERSYNTERQAHRLHALLTSLTNNRGVKVD